MRIISNVYNRVPTPWILPLALLATGLAAHAGTVVLNFDSVVFSGQQTDATAYLNSFGVTFTALTPNTTPAIQNTLAGGSAAIASSLPNVFDIPSPVGPAAVSYKLNFATPLISVSFTRTAIISISGDAPWTASALNAMGDVVASASEGFLIGPTAQTYTFTGLGITALEIDARNDLTRTSFNSPPIDDLTLVSSAPEPTSLLLFGAALGLLLLRAILSGLSSVGLT